MAKALETVYKANLADRLRDDAELVRERCVPHGVCVDGSDGDVNEGH